MLRCRQVLPAVAVASLVGVCFGSVSNASPSDGAGAESCSFVLTPPTVVQVSDTSMVLATVKPGPCTLDGNPNHSTVCVSIQGADSQGQCGNKQGPEPASVYYPYRPGATYVVTGRGCADVYEDPTHPSTGPMHTVCQSLGPFSFAL
jgi:hypothetical protein